MTMQSDNTSQWFEQTLSPMPSIKRSIRVNSSKLPSDFFHSLQLNRYEPKRGSTKKSSAKQTTRQTSTPTFERDYQLNLNAVGTRGMRERKIQSARVNVNSVDNMNKDDTLIHEVISTARNLRRVLRKKSLQMVRNSISPKQPTLHLPQIRNQRLVSVKF